MLNFSAAILLYLAIGSVAAPAFQARDTTSVAGSSAATSAQSDPAQSSAAGDHTTTTSSAQASGASDQSTAPTSTESTSAYKPAGSDLSLGTEPSVMEEFDRTQLYGPDQRPNITHLAPVQGVTADTKNSDMFEAAGSILLALTKCNDQGYWIKSMFGPPQKSGEEDSDEDQETIGVMIHTVATDGILTQTNITVDRSKLEKVASYDISIDKISTELPWWPWALFEAGLQAGWNPEAEDGTYNVQDLLAIYTGVGVKSSAPDDYFYGEVIDHLQSTPVFVHEEGHAAYSFLMTPSFNDTEGHLMLSLAGPYKDQSTDAALAKDVDLAELKPKIDMVMYLDGLLSLSDIEAKTGGTKSDPAESSVASSNASELTSTGTEASTGTETLTGTETAGADSTLTEPAARSTGSGSPSEGSTQAKSTDITSAYAEGESSAASSAASANATA